MVAGMLFTKEQDEFMRYDIVHVNIKMYPFMLC